MKWNWVWPISIWSRQKFSSSAPSLKFCTVYLPVLCNNKKKKEFFQSLKPSLYFTYSRTVSLLFVIFPFLTLNSDIYLTNHQVLLPAKGRWLAIHPCAPRKIELKYLRNIYIMSIINTMIMSYKEWPIENSLPLKYVLLLLSEQLFGNTLLYVFLKMNTWDYF